MVSGGFNEFMDDYMEELVEFITDTDDKEFFNKSNGIFTIFDEQNLIDFYVYNFFILHKDFWEANYFIIRNSYPNKLWLFPWDYDNSWGQSLRYKTPSTENHTSKIRELNALYDRLLQNETFLENCTSRWKELRDNIWTEDYFLDQVEEMYDEIENVLELDFEIWYSDRDYLDLDERVDLLKIWIPQRLLFCDLYFENITNTLNE